MGGIRKNRLFENYNNEINTKLMQKCDFEKFIKFIYKIFNNTKGESFVQNYNFFKYKNNKLHMDANNNNNFFCV